VAADAAVA
jgi:hypothetical protein